MHRKTLSISGSACIRTGLALLVLVLVAASNAQPPDTAWTFRYGPVVGMVYQPLASFVDVTGNVYVAGWAEQTGEIDALLLKITADSGHLVWAKTYPHMTASGAAVDANGNVYIAGITTGTSTAGRICVLKYLPSGDTAWTHTYSEAGLSFTSVGNIAIDSQYVYACGRAGSTVRIVKYSLTGTAWGVMSYSSAMPLWGGQQFHILRDGGVYLTLVCEHPVGNARLHWLVVKLSGQGQVQWERVFRDTGSSYEWPYWSQVDEHANIYIAGEVASPAHGAELYCTVKMDSLGDTLWTREYLGPENLSGAPDFLMLDKGSVYVAGWSIHKEMGGYEAIVLVKYDSLGIQQWVSRYGASGNANADLGYSNGDYPTTDHFPINADDSGNVYLTGSSLPGDDVIGILLQYDPQGNLVRERQLCTPGERWFGATVAIDRTGSLYQTGIHVLPHEGYIEIFVAKYPGR